MTKNFKGVITYDYSKRFIDRVTKLAWKVGAIKLDGYYPIYDNSGKEVSRFQLVYGLKPIVRFLERASNYKPEPGGKKFIIKY